MTQTDCRIRNPKLAVRRFLDPVRAAFTTRPDGSSWARAASAWRMARAYVEGLAAPAVTKPCVALENEWTFTRIASSDSSRRAQNHDALQDHLNDNIPDSIASLVVSATSECPEGRCRSSRVQS